MKAIVIDASVVASAIFREPYSAAAKATLVGAELHAPDFIFAEITNVIWKRHRAGEIDNIQATELLAKVRRLPLKITPCDQLVESALKIAIQAQRSVYDSIYLALAVQIRSVMTTTDERLVNALAAGPFSPYVRWVGKPI